MLQVKKCIILRLTHGQIPLGDIQDFQMDIRFWPVYVAGQFCFHQSLPSQRTLHHVMFCLNLGQIFKSTNQCPKPVLHINEANTFNDLASGLMKWYIRTKHMRNGAPINTPTANWCSSFMVTAFNLGVAYWIIFLMIRKAEQTEKRLWSRQKDT